MRNTKEMKLLRMKRRIGIYVKRNKILSIILGGTIAFSIINIVLILNFMTLLEKM